MCTCRLVSELRLHRRQHFDGVVWHKSDCCHCSAGVTAIQGQWLADVAAPMCKFSEPLTEPAPAYKPDEDDVVAWHKVRNSNILCFHACVTWFCSAWMLSAWVCPAPFTVVLLCAW